MMRRFLKCYYARGILNIVYFRKSEYSQALTWHQNARAVHEKVLGKENPNTVMVRDNIADLRSRM